MKLVNKWYLPDSETNYLEYFKNLKTDQYQEKQRQYSMKFLSNKRTALDIGANIGFWARDICRIFKKVELFEPHKLNIECLQKNLQDYKNFKIHEYSLSNFSGNGELYIDDNGLGNNTLSKDSGLTNNIIVKVKKLDDLDLNEIDFIKIDVQSHELEVIEGSVNTLKRNSPVLCIEAPKRTEKELSYLHEIKKILKNLEYKVVGRYAKELIFKK